MEGYKRLHEIRRCFEKKTDTKEISKKSLFIVDILFSVHFIPHYQKICLPTNLTVVFSFRITKERTLYNFYTFHKCYPWSNRKAYFDYHLRENAEIYMTRDLSYIIFIEDKYNLEANIYIQDGILDNAKQAKGCVCLIRTSFKIGKARG